MSLENQLEEWREGESRDLKAALKRLIAASENPESNDLAEAIEEAKATLKTYYF